MKRLRRTVFLLLFSPFLCRAADLPETFQRGDLLIATTTWGGVVGFPAYKSLWTTPEGEVRAQRSERSELFFFGPTGFLNAPSVDRTYRYDAHFEPAGDATHLLDDAYDVALAADGSFLVARIRGVTLYTQGGKVATLLPSLEHVTSIDLAADQCTLAYVTYTDAGLYDVCTRQPLRTLERDVERPADIRFLPDGTVLLGTFAQMVRFRPDDGSVIARTLGRGGPMALSPDKSFAWVGWLSYVFRYDLATNTLDDRDPITLTSYDIVSMASYGEWFAATGEPVYDDDIVIDSIEGLSLGPGATITLRGRGWLDGAAVTIGGLEVDHARVFADTITFRMPSGAMTTRDVIVTNPNGQRGMRPLYPSRRRAVR